MVDLHESTRNQLKAAGQELGQAVSTDQADSDAWLRRVQAASNKVYGALVEHRHNTEVPAGLLQTLTNKKPGLMPTGERLEHEYADMLHRAAEIEVACAHELMSGEGNLEVISLQARILSDVIALHLIGSNAMLYQAYFQEEGGES